MTGSGGAFRRPGWGAIFYGGAVGSSAGGTPPAFRVEILDRTVLRAPSGEEIRLPPKVSQVLGRLAISAPRVVDRDALISAVWGDTPPATARKSLQTYVVTLRRAATPDLVHTTGDGYRLSPGVSVDAQRVRQLASRIHNPADADAAISEEEARWLEATLPPGELLRGLRDADVEAQRTGLRHDRTRCLTWCATYRLARGELAEAEQIAVRVLADDPFIEHGWVVLISVMVAQNRRAEVAATFLRAHRRLDEVGLRPGGRLAALHRKTLAADPEVPPLSSSLRSPTSTSFVGREREMAEVHDLLGVNQIVTITGPGGVGKTRLAQEVATADTQQLSGMVDLSNVRGRDSMLVALGQTLGATPVAGAELEPEVQTLLAGVRGLVLVDCADLVVDDLARLLASARLPADARFLITSRQRLGLPSEVLFHLSPLETAASSSGDGRGGPSPADRLLEARARRSRRLAPAEHAAVTAIATRVDGLPLALELAGARLATVPAPQLLAELDDLLSLSDVGSTRPRRHQTLRETIQWSHDRLGRSARLALGVLSVLPAGADTELLTTLDVLDGAIELAEMSLAFLEIDSGRYQLLDVIQQYGRELALPELPAELLDRLLQTQVVLAVDLDAQLRTPAEGKAVRRITDELPNFRSAFYLLGELGRGEDQIWLAAQFACYATWRSRPDLAAWFGATVAQAPRIDIPGYCRATGVVAWASYVAHDTERVAHLVDRAIGAAPRAQHHEAAELGQMVAHALAAAGDFVGAQSRLRDAQELARSSGNRYAQAMNLGAMVLYGALAPEITQDWDAVAEQARSIAAELGVPTLLAWSWYATGMWQVRGGQLDEALLSFEEALAMAEEGGATLIDAVARRSWTAISPDLSPQEVLASHLRTMRRMRATDQPRQSMMLLPWMIGPLAQLERDGEVLQVQRLIRRFGHPGRVPQAPGYDEGLAEARRRLGQQAGRLAGRPVPELERSLDDLEAMLEQVTAGSDEP